MILGMQLYNDPDEKIIASFGRKYLHFRRTRRTPLDNPLLAPTSERLLPSWAQLSYYLTGTVALLAALLQFLAIFWASDLPYPTQLLSKLGNCTEKSGKCSEVCLLGKPEQGFHLLLPPNATYLQKVPMRLLNPSDADVLQVVLCCWELTCVPSSGHTAAGGQGMEILQRLPVVIRSPSRMVSTDLGAPPQLPCNPRTSNSTPARNTNKAEKCRDVNKLYHVLKIDLVRSIWRQYLFQSHWKLIFYQFLSAYFLHLLNLNYISQTVCQKLFFGFKLLHYPATITNCYTNYRTKTKNGPFVHETVFRTGETFKPRDNFILKYHCLENFLTISVL